MHEMGPQMESSKLTPEEMGLYKNFVTRNPGITEADFKELRTLALGSAPAVQKFYEVNGILMKELPDRDEREEQHIKG